MREKERRVKGKRRRDGKLRKILLMFVISNEAIGRGDGGGVKQRVEISGKENGDRWEREGR